MFGTDYLYHRVIYFNEIIPVEAYKIVSENQYLSFFIIVQVFIHLFDDDFNIFPEFVHHCTPKLA
jgi:hypothetical protein